jgi:hypothetical protein
MCAQAAATSAVATIQLVDASRDAGQSTPTSVVVPATSQIRTMAAIARRSGARPIPTTAISATQVAPIMNHRPASAIPV